MNNRYIWGDIYERLFDDFLPLCTFGTSNLELKKCTTFKKSTTRIHRSQCFTFDELSSFTPKLGLNQGANSQNQMRSKTKNGACSRPENPR